jgi:hypothetical protein
MDLICLFAQMAPTSIDASEIRANQSTHGNLLKNFVRPKQSG